MIVCCIPGLYRNIKSTKNCQILQLCINVGCKLHGRVFMIFRSPIFRAYKSSRKGLVQSKGGHCSYWQDSDYHCRGQNSGTRDLQSDSERSWTERCKSYQGIKSVLSKRFSVKRGTFLQRISLSPCVRFWFGDTAEWTNDSTVSRKRTRRKDNDWRVWADPSGYANDGSQH